MAGKLRSFFIRDLLGEATSTPKTRIGKNSLISNKMYLLSCTYHNRQLLLSVRFVFLQVFEEIFFCSCNLNCIIFIFIFFLFYSEKFCFPEKICSKIIENDWYKTLKPYVRVYSKLSTIIKKSKQMRVRANYGVNKTVWLMRDQRLVGIEYLR